MVGSAYGCQALRKAWAMDNSTRLSWPAVLWRSLWIVVAGVLLGLLCGPWTPPFLFTEPPPAPVPRCE